MFTKVLFVLGLVTLASSQYYGGGSAGYGGGYAGYGGSDNYGPPQPYSFGYDSRSHDGGSHSQQETGDGAGGKRGSYTLTHEGGTRTVNYYADDTGFHAEIDTNEPGTASGTIGSGVYRSSAHPGYGGIGGGVGGGYPNRPY